MTSAISATTSVFVTAVPKRMVRVRRWLSMLPVVTGNLIGLLGSTFGNSESHYKCQGFFVVEQLTK